MSTDALSPEVQVAIARVRDEVAALHTELVRYGLVVWTGGNVSGRVPGADLFVIKPSGVSYDDLDPANMILCTLDGSPELFPLLQADKLESERSQVAMPFLVNLLSHNTAIAPTK